MKKLLLGLLATTVLASVAEAQTWNKNVDNDKEFVQTASINSGTTLASATTKVDMDLSVQAKATTTVSAVIIYGYKGGVISTTNDFTLTTTNKVLQTTTAPLWFDKVTISPTGSLSAGNGISATLFGSKK